ncbi:hypothetical protein N431DRAFT_193303 [Stipitochalara longipes BDJ]|nr:hypothetical protein N431DRAFT_193303 [Stipitochalara longipes BDJ]
MSKSESEAKKVAAVEGDDEPDEWDKRIFSTGCAGVSRWQWPLFREIHSDHNTVENTKMNDCYYDKKDWRLCKNELEMFRKCWKQHQNDKRTEMKDT